MKINILDLIDFAKVDTLLEGFNKSTGFVTAILDLEGNVLSKSGWRQICTQFHRVNPETSKKCTISDTVLAGKMEEGEKYHFYQCLNGLVDVAVPIVIKGEHIANLFSGQFFFEEPDHDFFKRQAEKYGFNENNYLKALKKVPVVSKVKVLEAMDFLQNVTHMISDMTFQKMEQMELNETILKSEARFRSIFENNLATMLLIEPLTHRIVDANFAAERFYGWSRLQLSQMTIDQINTLPSDELQKEMEIARSQKRINFKFKHRLANGSVRDVEIYSSKVEIDGKEYLHSIIHDITEQVKVENAIKRSDRIFRLFIEHSPASIAMFDNNMNYLVASRRFLIDYNLGNQDVIGRSHYEVFPEISDRWKDIHRRCLTGEILSDSNDPFPRADGTIDWVRWEIRPWYESENHIGGIILFSEVITSQIEDREALKESEKYNRMLFEQSVIGLLLTSLDGKLIDINLACANIIGRTIEEAKTLTYWEITPEKYQIQEQHQLDLLAKTGRYGPYEKEYIHKDGHLVPVRLQGLIIERHNEKFIWSSVEDISVQKKVEAKIKLLNRAIESSSVSVVITDREGTIEYVNPYSENATGYSYNELIGKNPSILKSGNQSNEFYEDLWNTILSGKNWEGELQNRKKNGELYWEKAVISPIVNSEGITTNFVAIKEDVTDRKRILKELVVAKEKAEESDRLKTAFLNNISHEIRTPLNSILGFGQFLAESEHSFDERIKYFNILQKSSNRLMNTVSDYMDMAMIVSGTMEMHKKEFFLQPFFEEIIEGTKQLCANKKIDFELHIPSEPIDIMINSDQEFIRKIMVVFLDNALKFTKHGSISCGYRINSDFLEFFVQDTGKGIDVNKIEIIFDIFSQEDVSNTRGYEGSGLGLAIAKGLVKLLGGSISAISEKGKGSTFTFTVPYAVPAIPERPSVEKKMVSTDISKLLVLIAEDEESNYFYMEVIMKMIGCKYIHAINGAEAVEMCKQNTKIDLVLMDIKMPVMNGLEATQLIHEFRPELPIIATTAYAQIGDEHRFLDAGCDGYLAKPIRKDNLLVLLQKYT